MFQCTSTEELQSSQLRSTPQLFAKTVTTNANSDGLWWHMPKGSYSNHQPYPKLPEIKHSHQEGLFLDR